MVQKKHSHFKRKESSIKQSHTNKICSSMFRVLGLIQSSRLQRSWEPRPSISDTGMQSFSLIQSLPSSPFHLYLCLSVSQGLGSPVLWSSHFSWNAVFLQSFVQLCSAGHFERTPVLPHRAWSQMPSTTFPIFPWKTLLLTSLSPFEIIPGPPHEELHIN